MLVQPYLYFDGRCEEAMGFYEKAIGAEVLFRMRFKEGPGPVKEGTGEKIMHATLRVGGSEVMVSDGHCGGGAKFEGFSLSLGVDSDEEAVRVFNALAEGGQVRMPLAETFFASRFGMLADRFGVGWMVMARAKGDKA